MTVRYLGVCLLLIFAVASDISTRKIKNAIIVSFASAGLIFNLLAGGPAGAGEALAALFVPIPALIVFYVLGMLGAGDIKLFCALGAICGTGFVLYAMAYSFLAGGAAGIVLMVIKGTLVQRWRYLANYLKACFLCRSLLPYGEDSCGAADGARFRFSGAAALGTAVLIISRI